jgi:hypothetical protein
VIRLLIRKSRASPGRGFRTTRTVVGSGEKFVGSRVTFSKMVLDCAWTEKQNPKLTIGISSVGQSRKPENNLCMGLDEYSDEGVYTHKDDQNNSLVPNGSLQSRHV